MAEHRDQEAIDAHVSFAGRLTRWMAGAGVAEGSAQADLGVGFADIIEAARHGAEELSQLLETDPSSGAGAAQALSHLGYLHALFLGEIKSHLEDLEQRWPELEAKLAATAGFADEE